MRIKKVEIKNFRLLNDVSLFLETSTTVIVGRNNSGKTSLAELFRRILNDGTIQFQLEDFSQTTHEAFIKAFDKFEENEEEAKQLLPEIELKISVEYDKEASDIVPLSDFIIDLDPESNVAIVRLRYSIKSSEANSFLSGIKIEDSLSEEIRDREILKQIKEKLQKVYSLEVVAVDPTDDRNQKKIEISKLRSLLRGDFINAQRGLDDITHKEKDFLGKILEKIFTTSNLDNSTEDDKNTAKELADVVSDIQKKIDEDFNKSLNKFLPALKQFGYPGLTDPNLKTETVLDTQRLLSNHTKLRYMGSNPIGLPEGYNGLGSRNLIYILFQLFEFFKSYQSNGIANGVHLIFIEEPEAHLHPQMQEVFVKQINDIVKTFSEKLGDGKEWPVQFVVTTHSTHMANATSFDSIRYFLSKKDGYRHTCIKDLRAGFSDSIVLEETNAIQDAKEKEAVKKKLEKEIQDDKKFLHKYLTLTRCDLFFADKSILVEGASERILLPRIIQLYDKGNSGDELGSQYIASIEVGGAYAHRFFRLLKYLELPTLIITDIDSVKYDDGSKRNKKSQVKDATGTSNAVLKNWFNEKDITPETLILKVNDEKENGVMRIAYQVPENGENVCGRSFEDAFILANKDIFKVQGESDDDVSNAVWEQVGEIDKTDFALEYGVEKENWKIPKYISDGLDWLVKRN